MPAKPQPAQHVKNSAGCTRHSPAMPTLDNAFGRILFSALIGNHVVHEPKQEFEKPLLHRIALAKSIPILAHSSMCPTHEGARA
jgi:hypothetical protein